MHRVNVGLMCLLSLSFGGLALGQNAGDPQTAPQGQGVAPLESSDPGGSAAYNSYSGGATLGSVTGPNVGAGSYFGVRHMTGPGVGYTSSYSTLQAFIPFWANENVFVAPDMRLNLSNNSQFGANLGLVSRYYVERFDRTFGGYGYYDVDQSSSNNVYSQTTFGLESLGNWLDVRANGYFPNGSQDNYVSAGPGICVSGNPYFSGNNVVFQGVQGQNRETAATGGDFEVGMPLSQSTPWLRGYAGVYFYHANQLPPVAVDDPIPGQKSKNPVGFRGRVDAWLTDDLLTGVQVTTDQVWGTNVNAYIDFRFSGFKPTRYFPQWTTRQRMLAPVQRNWRIAVEQYGSAGNTPVAAVDPTTGKPYFVEFIDNSAPAGGNGTYEHPFSSNNLNNFQNNQNINLILVERGNSTAASPYTGSIQLFNNQTVLGQGAANVAPLNLAATYGGCSVSGSFALPGIDGSGKYPFISNSSTNPIFTLANNNQVAGFNLINSGGDAIYGNNVKNFNLHDLEITGNAGRGIALTNATGPTTIISNINTGVADNPNPNGYGNNAGGGILVTTGIGGISNLQLTNVKMNSSPTGTQPFGISLSAVNGPLTYNETNVQTNGNGTGQSITEVGQALVGTFNTVTSNNNLADGIDITGNGGMISTTSSSAATPLFTDGNGGSGLVFTMTGGTGQLNLTGNQANQNGLNGVGIFGLGGANMGVTIVNGQMNNNIQDGYHHEASGGSTITSNVDPTSITQNGRDGIYFSATGNSKLVDTFTGDTLNNNTRSAIYGTMNSSNVLLTLTNIQGTNSDQNGIHLDAAGASVFTANIKGSNFSNSVGNGLDVQVSGKSTATFNLLNSLIDSSGQNNVKFLADTASVFALNATGTTFDGGSGGAGISGTAQNGSTANVTVAGAGSSLSNNKGDGVMLTATGLSNVNASFNSTAINGNLNNGIQLSLTNSPGSSLAVTGVSTINGNSANGIRVDASNQSFFTPTINGATINNNAADGVLLNVNSGSTIAGGTFTNSVIQHSHQNGVETNITGAGSNANILFSSTQINNSNLAGIQFAVTNGGALTTEFTRGSSLTFNMDAVNGTVNGTGTAGSSTASILLDGTNASNSVQNNAQLNVTAGGLLQFTAQGGANLSNSQNGSGLIANVQDLNSVAFVDLNNVLVTANAVNGLAGTVSDTAAPGAGQKGAILNADLEGTNFSGNGTQGLSFSASGPAATANVGAGIVGGTPDSVNGNGMQGLLAVAVNQAAINFRSVGSTFDNNGFGTKTPGAYDGISFQSNNATIRALLYGGEANYNTGDGVGVGPVAPATNTANSAIYLNLGNGFASKGNNGDALNFNVAGSNSAYLVTDTVAPPSLQGPINLDYAGVSTAVVNLTGSFMFNNQPGDGFTANFNGAQTAIFFLNGLGTSTADANQGNGINVNMTNVTNGAVTIEGFSNISNNKDDGIHIGLNNVLNAALLLQGPTTNTNLVGDGGSGINLQMNGVNLVNNFNNLTGVANLSVLGLTTTDNNPLDKSVPAVVSVPVNVTGSTPATGLLINNFTVSGSGSTGIAVDGTNTTIANGGSISSNNVDHSTGDGIQFILNDQVGSTANGFQFNNNTATFNTGDGINVQLTNVSMTGSQFRNLTGSNNGMTGVNLALTNSSMNNLDLTGAIIANLNGNDGVDISLTNSSLTPSKGPSSITANNNSGNGVDILSSSTSNIFLDIKSLTANGNSGAGFVGTDQLASELNISLDNPSSVSNNNLQGLILTVSGAGSTGLFNVNTLADNHNGQQGLKANVNGGGQLDFRSVNSTYNTNGLPSGANGVSMQVGGGGSSLITLFSGGTVNGNGGAGFVFAPEGANMSGATISASINNGIVVSGNKTDAIDFIAPNATNAALLVGGSGASSTIGGPMTMIFGGAGSQTSIADLNGTFNLNGSVAGAGLTAEFLGSKTSLFAINGGGTSTANGNALDGIAVSMANSQVGSVQVTGFASASNNKGDGFDIGMSNITAGALALQGSGNGTQLMGNAGNGLETHLSGINLINNFAGTVPAPTVTVLTTGSNQPAPLGVLPLPTVMSFNMTGQAPTTALSVNDFDAANNGKGGVIVDGTLVTIPNASGSISNNTATGNKNGDGIQFELQNNAGSAATGFLFNNNLAQTNKGGDGIRVVLDNVNMSNSQFENLTGSFNTGTGVDINLTNSSLNNVNMAGAITASGNNTAGLSFTFDNSTMTPLTGPTTVTTNGNIGNGVTITETANSNLFLDIGTMTSTNNTGAGFSASATTGSSLNICLDAGTLSNNGTQGLNILVTNPASSGNINLTGLSVNANGLQGLLSEVENGATLYYRSVNTTYNNNGATTSSDGVDMRADGTGTTLLALFDGGTANGNSRDGFHFGGLTDGASMNGAYITASLYDSVAASGNGRYALNFNANGAGTANLQLDPVNPPVFNGLTNINYMNVSNAVANLTGTFHFDNNGSGDGLTASFSNAQTVAFFLNGLGNSTADGNNGAGINISMANVQNASVVVEGFSNISGNKKDGIDISMTNTSITPTTGAIELQGVAGQTTMTGNQGNAINVQLSNVNLINNFATTVTPPSINYLTTTSNLPAPLDCLALPVISPVNLTGLVPNTGLTVNNFTVANSGLGGIIVDGNTTTIAAGGSISNDSVSGSQGGDGIQLGLTNMTTADNFLFNGNNSTGNSGGNGINITLVNATMNNLSMTGAMNVGGNALDGLHFDLTNSSLAVTTSPTSVSAIGNTGNGVYINEVTNSNFFLDIPKLTATGNTLSGLTGNALSGSTLNLSVDGGTSSSDTTQGINLMVDGTGSTANINIGKLTVNANTEQGLLAAVTNGGTLNYRSANSTYSGNGLTTTSDGVDLRVDATGNSGSVLRALFTNDAASGNGRDGFHIGGSTDGASTNGSTVTVSMSGVTAVSNARDSLNMGVSGSTNAYLIMDPTSASTLNGAANLDFSNITTGTGLATMSGTFTFNGSKASNGLTANFSNDLNAVLYVAATGASTANANALSGININMTNATFASASVGGFTDISANKGGDGITATMTNTAAGALALNGVSTGTTVIGNSGDGINVTLNNVNLMNNYVPNLNSPQIVGLTTTSNLTTPSALLPAPTPLTVASPYSPASGFSITNFTANSNSGADGILVTATNTSTPATFDAFTNNIADNNLNGNGIYLNLIGSTFDNLDMTGTNVASGNGLDGLRIDLSNSFMTPTTAPATFIANNNGVNGVEINSTSSSNIFMDFGSLTANGNKTGSGFIGTATGGSTLNIGIEAGSLSSNATNGLSLTVDGASSISNFNLGPIQSLTSAGVAVNANGSDNLYAGVGTSGTLNFRSINNTFNGSTGGDGVNMQVGINSTLRTLFLGGSANNNAGNGYDFRGNFPGATVTTTLDGITSTGNTFYSLNFNAHGAASANLLQGTNAITLSGPAYLDLSNLSAGATAIANLSGTFNFNNSTAGNGLTALFTNDKNAIFSLVDATNVSTADGNALGGISVDMSNVTTNGSVLIQGFKDISNNKAGDGLAVTMTNTTNGALTLTGVAAGTTVNGNAGDGVNVTLSGVTLNNNFTYNGTETAVTVITTASSLTAPMQNLPLPVSQALNFTGQVPTTGFSINNFTANLNKGADGILVTATNTTAITPTTPNTASSSTFENNSANNNGNGNGIYLNLTGSTFDNLDTSGVTSVSGNKLDGLRIDLSNSNMTQLAGFTPSGTTVISANGNGSNGVEVNSTNTSNVFLDISALIAGNGGGTGNTLAGFAGTASGTSTLNICLDAGTIANNGTQGLNINIGTGSTSNFNLGPVSTVGAGVNVNNNGDQGLLAVVSGGSTLNLRSINTTYNNNGKNGVAAAGDGVDMQVNGGASVLRTLFSGGTSSSNLGAGYSFVDNGGAANGDTLTVGISGVTATGNGGNGLTFNGSGTANANLLMDPTNPSTIGGNSSLTVTGVTKEVVLQTDGLSFNTGLNLTFDKTATGITDAFVSLNGNGTATINQGVSITMNGLDNGSVYVNNYAQVNNVAGSAVNVNINGATATAGFTNAAIDVQGPSSTTLTTMGVGGGGTGVNVVLIDTKLINNLAASATLPTIQGLATNPPNVLANQAAPFDCLPAVVTLQLNTLNVIPANALTVSDLNITGNSGANGISVVGTNSTIQANGGFITGNTVGGTLSGDAIAVSMTNNTASNASMIDGLQVTGNTVNGGNGKITGDGIRVDVFNTGTSGTAADDVNLSTNTVTGVGKHGMEFLVVNPATSVHTVTSLNISGNTVTGSGQNGLNLNLSYADLTVATAPTLNNDTFSSNGNDGIRMTLLGTNISNLSTVSDTLDKNANNGLEINLNASTIAGWTASNGGIAGTGDISGNGTGASGTRDGVYISTMNTSSVTGATFDTMTINKNGADGVSLMQADATVATFGSAANPITFTGGSISDNGQKTTGNGVNLNALANNSVSNLVFTNEAVNNTLPGTTQQNGLIYRTGDGTTVAQVNVSVTGGSFSNNHIDGINATINGNTTTGTPLNTVTLNRTTISGNGGIGTLFNLNNAETLNLTIQDNAGIATTISNNGSDGVQINAIGVNTVATTQIVNSTIQNNGVNTAGNGVTGMFDLGATGTFTVTNDTIGNSAAGGTQQNGIDLLLNTGTMDPRTDVVANISNTQLTFNAASGLYVNAVGAGTVPTNGAHITLDAVTVQNNGGMGVSLNASQGGLINFTAQDLSKISNSGLNGMYIYETDANTLVSVLVTDTTVNSNGTAFFPGDGVNATTLSGSTLDLEATTTGLGPASFSNNTGNGINLTSSGASSRIDLDLHNAIVGSSTTYPPANPWALGDGTTGNLLNGLKFQSFDGAMVNVQAYKTTFDSNGGAGVYGTVNDTLGLNTSGIVRIVGGEANGNAGSAALGGGFNFAAINSSGSSVTTATMTAFFQPDDAGNVVTATGNTGYGLSFSASNPNAPYGGVVGNLLMTGNNLLSGNVAGSVNVNMNGAQQAIVGLSGTFDNNSGDGIDVSLSHILGLGLVSLQGGGTGEVFNNGGNGINVTLSDVNNGGVFIGGFKDVSQNGTSNGAGGLGQDGIKVTMTDVGGFTNGAVLPKGVGALTIDGALSGGATMQVSNNTGSGINVAVNSDGSGSSIIDNTKFTTSVLTSNQVQVIVNSPTDQTTNVPPAPPLPPVPQLPAQLPMLTLNNIDATSLLGFKFSPTVAIQNLTMDSNGNATGGNLVGSGIQMLVDNSQLVGVPTINNDIVTNTGSTSATGTHDGIQVQLLNAADVTGLDVVNNTITGGNGNGVNIIAGGATAGNTALTLASLNISNDTISGNTGTTGVSGNGIDLQLLNAPVLSTITIATDTITNNLGDGVQMVNPNTGYTGNTHNSDLTVNFTNDTVTGNGSIVPNSATSTYPPGGMGIDIVLNNLNAEMTTVNVLSNAAGVNTISNSASFGLFLQATNQARYNLNVTGTGGQNVFDSNHDAGIGIVSGSYVDASNNLDPTKFSVGSVLINNVLISNTIKGNHASLPNYPFAGDGIGVLAQQYAEFASFVVGDPTLRNTILNHNAGDGLRINAIENSKFRQQTSDANDKPVTVLTTLGQATVQLQNINATNSTAGNGIEIIRKDNALLSWDDPGTHAAAVLFDSTNPYSWSAITGAVNASYSGNYVYANSGSFVHLNDIISTGNAGAGLSVTDTNTQFPLTRIDIVDTAPQARNAVTGAYVGNSQYDSNAIGMNFAISANAQLLVNSQDTSASKNTGNGILISTLNQATFGDMLPTGGNPFNPASIPSTFNGMTISGNGAANKNANANGIEVQVNGNSDPNTLTSNSLVDITMTGSATNTRNLFDSNGGDDFKLNTIRFSNTNIVLDAIDMRDTQFVHLGSDGINITDAGSSTASFTVTNARIGYPTASSTQTGLSGNGIQVTTNANSFLSLTIGNQAIVNPDPTNAPDVGLYGNQLDGILINNNASSNFTSTIYDTSARFNGNRGFSQQMTSSSLNNAYSETINNSTFSDNGHEGVAVIANSGQQAGANFFTDVSNLVGGNPNTNPFNGSYNYQNFLNFQHHVTSTFVLANSTISNNGSTTPYTKTVNNVAGLEIDVSTNSLINADIRGNTLHGNTLDDVETGSFTATTGGFNPDGTVNTAGKLITPTSTRNTLGGNGNDRIFLEDTAQLAMRFVSNTGDQLHISSAASGNPNLNVTGANFTDPSGAKGLQTVNLVAVFEVDAFNRSTIQSVTNPTTFTGNFLSPLNGSVNDPRGILNQANYYVNSSVSAFSPVVIDDLSTGLSSTVTNYTAGGTFTTAATVNPAVGNTFRLHLLDTNTFNTFGTPQNVEGNTGGFTWSTANQTGFFQVGGSTPFQTYFNFPQAVFP